MSFPVRSLHTDEAMFVFITNSRFVTSILYYSIDEQKQYKKRFLFKFEFKGYGAIMISTSWSEICWNLENLTFRSKVTVVQSQDNLIIWVSAK
ncbi:hypothetical protein BpHYR1_044555 [Brachionus plicatilis]|uniref:Uncharacterized protein n=1 Tax=Brachionus plicatilis TaxID=10195 RepID=A0A3M7R1E7_BRAPC|nr:hypothetical protein BpHYR1_044555 [Brachionus plicatilis]